MPAFWNAARRAWGTGSVKLRLKRMSSGQSISVRPRAPRSCMRRLQSARSAAPTSPFLGSHPRRALVPPGARVGAQEAKHMQMAMQPGADRMKVSVRSPSDGSRVTGDEVTLRVATSGFTNRCDLAGKPVQPGTGHYHVLLDKSLVDMYCGERATISLAGVQPGSHTLTVVPAQNDH